MRDLLLILAAAILAFGGSLWAPFHLDDFALLQDAGITSADGWWRVFLPQQTRPLTWFTFWVNYHSSGSAAWGYHLFNLLLHLGSVVLCWKSLGRLVPAAAATVGTALFALHPIQTEAVVYVFDRATLLMTLFCLAALYEWTKDRPWIAVMWFVPALLAKEECVAFPLVLLLLDRRKWRAVTVMLAMSLAAGLRVLYASSVTKGSGAGVQSGIAPMDYLLTQGAALLRYLRLLILPYGFSIESPLEVTGPALGVVAWLAVLGLACLIAYKLDRRWVLAWLLLIAPSSTTFPAADLSADRRMYLPMIAVGALVGCFLQHRPRWVAIGLSAAFAVISMRQTLIWQNPERLWGEAMHVSPQKLRPYIQVARLQPPAQALATLSLALKVAPDDPAVPAERGRILLGLNSPEAALAEFGRALALAPDDARAVNNRGVALLRMNQKQAAIADFERALAMEPCQFDARRNLYAAGGKAVPPPSHCSYTPEQRDSLPR